MIFKQELSNALIDYMNKNNITKTAMAEKLNTSRAELDRILDPENESITMRTVIKAAKVIGKQLIVKIQEE